MIFRISSLFYAVSAILRSLWAKIAGYRVLTTPEEQESRLSECEICEFLTEERQCAVCTCFVDSKTLLAAEACPQNRWRAVWVRKSEKSG